MSLSWVKVTLTLELTASTETDSTVILGVKEGALTLIMSEVAEADAATVTVVFSYSKKASLSSSEVNALEVVPGSPYKKGEIV